MSYSQMLLLDLKKDTVEYGVELRNSWRTAPIIWGAMCKRFFGEEAAWITSRRETFVEDLLKHDLPDAHLRVLSLTLDRAFLSKENYVRFAKDLRCFLDDYKIEVRDQLEKMAEILESGEVEAQAIAIWWSSVSDTPFSNGFNEEMDEPEETFDLSGAWDIYDDSENSEGGS